jgi:PAS domain S-box-containing protein
MDLGSIQQHIDENNRQRIKLLVEFNNFIAENNLSTDKMVPGYKLDSNGKFLEVNVKLAALLGYSSEKELMSAIAENSYMIIKSDLVHRLAGNDYYIDRPLYLRTKNGSYISLLEALIKLKEDGHVCYFGLVKRKDLLGRIKQEDAIFLNLVSQLYGEMKSGVVICDNNGMILYENRAMRFILGYGDNEELPSQYVSNYMQQANRGKIKKILDKLFETEKQTPNIAYILVGNGSRNVDVELYSFIMTFEDHKFCVSVVSKVDTEAKNVHAPRVNNLVFRDAFNIMSELYLLISVNGDICDINNAAMNMWGWDYDSCITKSIFELGNFTSPDMKRNLSMLCENRSISEYIFIARNTVWGEQMFTARLYPVGNENHIAVVMDNRREIQQVKDNLQSEYKNNMALFENSLCGIIVLHGNEIVKANKYASSLLKITYDIRGELLSEIFRDTKRKKRRIVTTQAGRREEAFEYEVNSEKRRTLLEVHMYDIDKDSTLCYFSEIPPRKANHTLLRDAVSRYKSIVEQSPCGVLIGDKNGDIIDVSDRFCEMIKMPSNEILGKNISALFTSGSISSKPLDYTSVDAGEIISAERELSCGDGTIKIVEMYSSVISEDMYQAVILDITSRKIYENQMLEYRRQVQKMDIQKSHFLKMSKDITVVFTQNVELVEIFVGESSPFFEYFKNENEFIDIFIKYISRKELDILIRLGVARAFAGNGNEVLTNEVTVGGLQYIVEARFMPIDGNVLMIVTDVTERERIFKELKVALKKSEENEKLQAAFLGNLSHELRTPMNGVIGFADLLLESEEDSDKREYLKIILDSSYQLLNVLSDIIEMSKLEAGIVKLNTEIVSVKKIIGDVCSAMHANRMVSENNVKLTNLAKSREEVLIISDSVKLRQIITNLTVNAIKFTKNGTVEIDYNTDGGKVCITVRDTGVGIAKSDINNIFDRFYQTKNVELATKGSGLGLAIVKSYVDMLQGTVKVESEEGKGSCFYVELPSRY